MSEKEETNILTGLFEEICQSLEKRETKMKFPLTIDGIETNDFGIRKSWSGAETGDWVAVRPCDKDCKGKTFLGIYLGDIPIEAQCYLNKEDNKIHVYPHTNPAMYVPDIKRIIWGCGSWWRKIKSSEDLEQITNKDIDNTWYVKVLKEMKDK